ncbi:Aromatic-ring hydroxylase-like protein [Niveomyces insectorum RCEF 264]|uniref:Aromatic-ring hydroxylase-like protein n=1 Tax=Niveomyces insectorum RCEF 264 TaxID=1081102 RepID=A0A167MHL8_9HYPO|nr:Aromatic-ring hydroxylase-like protein [Niveomyces insectorum RCEF 264]
MGAFLSYIKLFPSQLLGQTRPQRSNVIRIPCDSTKPSASIQSGGSTIPNNAEPPIHVAIIGSGIGGLSLAVGCLRNNVSFTIYESAPQYSVVGAGVGLGPNALRAMELLDPRLRALYDTISSGNLSKDKLHVAMEAMYAEPGFGVARGWHPRPFGAPCYERTSAHRADLLSILTSLIPSDAVRFNKRVTAIKQHPGEGYVTINFEDGDLVTATAAVGCDGVKGPSRGFVLGPAGFPDEVAPIFSGKYAYRAIVPMTDAQRILGEYAGDAKCFNGPSVNIMTYPISSGTECNIVACRFTQQPWIQSQWTHRVPRETIKSDFTNVDPRLVEMLDWAEPVQWALHHHIRTSTYYHDLVCLLGDVAHATTPHQASGAGMSIEDALVLSHVLGCVNRWQDIKAAFAAYDAVRRPRAQLVVETSQELGRIYSCTDERFGDDMGKIVDNLNTRFLWIWEHDLAADLLRAETIFRQKAKGT